MATTLGGVTLCDPDYERNGYQRELVDAGAFHELADGSRVYHYVSSAWRFNLRWNAITEAQRDAIETQALVKTSQAFSPPDEAGTYTVFVMPNSYRDDYIEDGSGTRRYYCELQLIEVA